MRNSLAQILGDFKFSEKKFRKFFVEFSEKSKSYSVKDEVNDGEHDWRIIRGRCLAYKLGEIALVSSNTSWLHTTGLEKRRSSLSLGIDPFHSYFLSVGRHLNRSTARSARQVLSQKSKI